jgi:hypothetical protein
MLICNCKAELLSKLKGIGKRSNSMRIITYCFLIAQVGNEYQQDFRVEPEDEKKEIEVES